MPTTQFVNSTITRIFNGTIDPATVNRTDAFGNATALYMVAPDSTLELELDFYLQLEIDGVTNRLIRLNDNYTLDTITVYPIPIELQGLGIPIYGVIIGGQSVAVEVYMIQRGSGGEGSIGCDLTEVTDKLNTIDSKINIVEETILSQIKRESLADNTIEFALSQIATGLGFMSVQTSVTTAGYNPALPFFSSSAILLGGGALLP